VAVFVPSMSLNQLLSGDTPDNGMLEN